MRIPTKNDEREDFYLDLIFKCNVSKEEGKGDYTSLRSWYSFGPVKVKPFAISKPGAGVGSAIRYCSL